MFGPALVEPGEKGELERFEEMGVDEYVSRDEGAPGPSRKSVKAKWARMERKSAQTGAPPPLMRSTSSSSNSFELLRVAAVDVLLSGVYGCLFVCHGIIHRIYLRVVLAITAAIVRDELVFGTISGGRGAEWPPLKLWTCVQAAGSSERTGRGR